MAEKLLRRSTEHKIIAGVCGGLAEYFETDPVLVRLIFLFFSLIGGSGILLYIALAIFIPEKGAHMSIAEEETERIRQHRRSRRHSHGVFGFFLIVVGLLFLLDNLFPGYGLRTYWPLLLILLGLAIMIKHEQND